MADIKSLIDKFNIFRTKDSILNDVAKDNGQITIDIKQPFSDDIDSNNSLKTKLETNIKDKLFNTEINNVGSNIFQEKIKPFDKGYNVSDTPDTDTKTPIDTTPIKPDTPTIEKNTADATNIQQEKIQQPEITTPKPKPTQQYKTITEQQKPKLTTDSLGNPMPIDFDKRKGKSYSGVGEQQIDEIFNRLDTPEKFDMFMQSVSEAYDQLKSANLNDKENIIFLPYSYDHENGNMNGIRLTFGGRQKEWAEKQLKILETAINDKQNEEWLSNLELPQPEKTMDKMRSNPWFKLFSFMQPPTEGMDPESKRILESGQKENRLNAIKWGLIENIKECKDILDKYYKDKSQVGIAISQKNIAETINNVIFPQIDLVKQSEIASIISKYKKNPKSLTPIENEIVKYYSDYVNALSVVANKTSTGYETVKAIETSLPFMADFLRFNLVGSATRGGTRAAMKIGGKGLARQIAKDTPKTIGARAFKLGEDILTAAGHTSVSPLTFTNMLEDYSQTMETNGQYTKNDLRRGVIEAFTENFSERMFGALKGILPKSNNAFVNSLFGNNPVIKSMQKHMNVGGLFEETGEEYAGAFVNTMFGFALGDEKLASSFKEQLNNSVPTILSIGITVGLPQAIGMGIDFREIKKMNTRFNVAEDNLKQYFNKENSYLDINRYSDALNSLYINLNNAKNEEDKAEIKGKIAELNKTAANLAMEKGDSNGFNLISEYSIAAQNSFYVTNKAMSELKNMSEEDRTKLVDNAINKLKNDFTNNLNWSLISRAAANNITDQNGKQHPTCFLYTDNGVTYVLNGQKDNMFYFVDVNGNTISKSADELRNNENLSVLHLNNLLSSFSNKELEDINSKFIDIAQYNAGYRYKVNDNGEIRYYTDNKDLIKSNIPYERIDRDKIESNLVGSYDLVRIDNITYAVEDMANAFAEPATEQTSTEQTSTEQQKPAQEPAQEQPSEEPIQEQPQEQTTQETAQEQPIQEQTTEEQETTEQEPIQPAQEQIEPAQEQIEPAQEQIEPIQEQQPAQEEDDSTALNGVPDIVDDTPQDARTRGFRRVNGYKIDRQKPLQAVNGKEISVRFSNDVIANGHVAVIDAEQLQPSHIQGVRNPLHFIDEAQPKERNDEASIVSAQRIAKNIRPEEITSSVTAYTGAPIINARGETIQGNNRSDALRLMWSQNKDQAEKYKQYLIDHAQEFGLNAEDIAAMERPILVNMIDVSDEDAIALGQYVAQDTESGGLERIKPKNAVQKMGADMRTFANLLLSSNDDEISFAGLIDKNGVDVLNWLGQKGYITPTQYKSAFDTKGYITAEAKNDLRGIMYQSIFQGGSTRLEEMFNTMPAKAQKAILATAFRDYDSPKSESMIVEIQNSIRAYYALSQSADFMNAKTYKDVRLAVEGWKKQYQIDDATGESYLPAENFSNFALLLATMYKGEKQTLIQGTFNKLYDLIQGTQEADLFETPDNTPRTLSQAIKEVLNIDYNGQQRSNVLVGDTTTSQRGEQGSTRDAATRERTKDGERTADSAGGIEAENRIAQNKQANTESQGKKPNIRRIGRVIGSSLSTDEFISETMSIVIKDVKTFPKEIRDEDIISKEQKSGKKRAGIKVKVGLLGNDLYIQYREGRSFANKNKELWEKVKRQYWATIKIPNATNYSAGQLRYRLDYAGTTTDIARIVSDAVLELFHKKELRLHKSSGIGNVSIQEAALRDAIIDKLREAGIEVITDVEEAQRVLDEANGKGVSFFRTADGNAYGFTVGGKIYIDQRIATADTPIHEYAHLWASAMQKLNPNEWENIVKLMKGTPIWEEVKRNYPELTTDNEIADEVLAFYSGSRGAERLREEHAKILKGNGNVVEKVKAINAIKRVREALKRFWKNVAEWFGIHFTTAEEVADKVLSDLLNGVNPTLAGVENDIRYRRASNRSVISSRFERQAEIQREEKNTKSAANIVLGNANVVLNDTNIFDEQYQNAIDNNLIDENVSPLIDSFGITWGYQLKNGVIVINKDVFVSDILDKRVKDNLSLLISSLMKTNKTFFKEGISFFKKLPIWVLYKNDTKSNEDTIKEIINDILLGNTSIDTNKLELLKQYTVQYMNDILDNATKWFEKFEGISSNMFAGNSISDILDTTLGDLMPKEITTTQEGKRLNWFSKLGIDIRSKLFDSLDWFRVVSDKTKDKTASELYDAMIVHTKRVQGKIDIFDKEYVRPIIDTIQSMLGKDFGNSTLSLDLIQEYFAIKSLLGRTASLYKEKFELYLTNHESKKPPMFDEFKQIYDEITEDEIRQRINEMGEKSSMSILQKVDIDYLMEEVRRTLAAEMFVKQYVYSSANTLNQGLQGEQSLGLINEVTNEPYSELYQLLYSDEQSSQTMHSPIEIIEQADILIDRAGLRNEFDFIGNQIQAILNYVNIERVENGLMSYDTFAKRQLMKDFVNQRGENSSEGGLYEITAKQKANEKMKGKDWFNPNSITSIIAVAQTEIATMEKELLAQRLSYFLTNPNNFDVLSQYGMIIDEKETLNEELSEDERNSIMDKNIVLLYGERHTDKNTKGQVDKKKINILKRNDDGTFTKVTISFDNKFIGLEEFVKFVNNNFKYEELRGISKAVAPFTAWTSRIYTILSPLFPTKNLFKDLMVTPWLPAKELNGKNSQYAIKNFYNVFNNLSFILKMSFTEKSFSKKGFENKLKARSQELFEYYLEYSKQHSIFSVEDQIGVLSKENKTLQDIERALSGKENKFIKFTERALLIKFMQHYAELFENLHKFSAYVTLRKLGYGEERSAQIANNATLNYDRSGSIGRQLNAIIPFAKAALGGLYRTNYLLPKYNPKGFLQRVITLAVLGVMQGLMYDPDDDDISEFARKSGMVFGSFLYPLLPEELSIVRPVRALVIVMAGKKSPAYFKQELMESTIDLVPVASDALRGAFSYNPLTNKTEFDVGQLFANTDKMTAVYALAMLASYINENKNSFGKNVLLNEETNTDKTRYGRTKQDYGLYDYLARLYNSIINGVDIDDRAAMSNKIGKNGERLMTIAKEDVEFVINNYIPFGRLYAYTAEIIYDAVNDKSINKGHIPLIGGLFAQKYFGKDYYLVNNIKYELKDFTNDFSQSQIEDIKTNILVKADNRFGIRYKALKDNNANPRMLDKAKQKMNDAFNVFILDINNFVNDNGDKKIDFTEDEYKFMLKSFLDSPIMKKALSIGEDTLNKHTAKRVERTYKRYKKYNNENIDTDKENMKDAAKNFKKMLYDKSITEEEFNDKLNSLYEPLFQQIKLRAKFAGYSIE